MLVAGGTIEDNNTGVMVSDTVGVQVATIRDNTTNGVVLAVSNSHVLACEITGSAVGILCTGASNTPPIIGNTIEGNGSGIKCYTSAPTISGNTIDDNTTGIYCDSSADPVVRGNRIENNYDGVISANYSLPDLGSGSVEGACPDTCANRGMNKIRLSTRYHVMNSTELFISAQCNYWGKKGPEASKFYGEVSYVPYLTSDPLPDPVSAYRPEDAAQGIPERFALQPSAPNPFNPSTRIRFDVPAPGAEVALEVFDVRGRRIKTLESGRRPPGQHVVIWNGRDEWGASVATGVYFVRMRAGTFAETRKIVLVK
jgi:parallel beta-helix repeat protein